MGNGIDKVFEIQHLMQTLDFVAVRVRDFLMRASVVVRGKLPHRAENITKEPP
jgi:hypothetical protein